jgi:hypothetical protein
MLPFELTISRPPLTLSLQAEPRKEDVSPRTAKQEFLERLKTLRIRSGGNLHQAQARYKDRFDKNVRPKNSEVMMFITSGGDGRRTPTQVIVPGAEPISGTRECRRDLPVAHRRQGHTCFVRSRYTGPYTGTTPSS